MTKVVLPTNDGPKPSKNSGLLPLVPVEPIAHTKDNSIGLYLATNPNDMDNSPKFKMQAYILRGGEDVRTVLNWQKDLTNSYPSHA